MSLRNYKKLVTASAPAITWLGLHRMFRHSYAGNGHILMFHRILPKNHKNRIHNHESLEIDPAQLEKILLYFKKKDYDFISMDDLQMRLSQPSERKFVIFTFDDGYNDNLYFALPVFQKYRVPFTIYLTTGFVHRSSYIWWYLLEEILRKNDTIEFHWNNQDFYFSCVNDREKSETFQTVRNLITRQPPGGDFHQQIKNFVDKYYPGDPMAFTNKHILTWKEVNQLVNNPLVTIGAHTVDHLPLHLTDETILQKEILDCKTELKKQTGVTPMHFAYPFGKIEEASTREFDFVRNSGYSTGVTTNIGNVFSEHIYHLHKLPRINISALTTIDVLELQISGMIAFFQRNKNPQITF